MICEQTHVLGVSVSQVARRYDVNANLVVASLRDPRFADADATDVACFSPVEIVAQAKVPMAAPPADGHIEIELTGGHRMRISGGYDSEPLARLIRELTV